MSNNDALIAKALSTSSEDEAIACLRMARKKGVKLNSSEEKSSSDYNGHNAKYWYEKAVAYYNKAKNSSSSYSVQQFNALYNMYQGEANSNYKNRERILMLERQVSKLKQTNKNTKIVWFLTGFSGAIILFLPFLT